VHTPGEGAKKMRTQTLEPPRSDPSLRELAGLPPCEIRVYDPVAFGIALILQARRRRRTRS
jgi:hypothetical protein